MCTLCFRWKHIVANEYVVCLGGNISQQDQQEHNGQGGSSYISLDGIDQRYEASKYC